MSKFQNLNSADQDELREGGNTELELFGYLLAPADSYTADGVYWADLPFGERNAFISAVNSEESAREREAAAAMFNESWLAPIKWYIFHSIMPGMGLMLEGYVLFSVSNVKSLFEDVQSWQSCWKDETTCNKNWLAAIDYLEIAGIISGQIFVGLIGDFIGRRWGMIQDTVIMTLGLVMLTAMWGKTLEGWVICYAWSNFFYSIGVGGEYPMTAASEMETSHSMFSSKADRLHRGRKVGLAFLMQGWGQVLNQVVLIVLLYICNHGTAEPRIEIDGKHYYSELSVQWIFRVSFFLPCLGTLATVFYRYKTIPAPAKHANGDVTGYNTEALKLAIKYFGSRLFCSCGAWFCNDLFFYGNKLFQSQFISIIAPNETGVLLSWEYSLINCFVSLAGYYLAAFFIDNKFYGRNTMSQVGFFADFLLFVIPAFAYDYFTSNAHVHAFQAMYYLSSFFNQFGPNAVTFLVAAEVFPTPVRATAHGIAAASGKSGALLAAVVYNYIGTQTKFYFVPWFGLAGMLFTFFLQPDVTGLDLREQDRRWRCIAEGRDYDYHGIAIHPRHLSIYERIRGVHHNYDPELDFRQKIDEIRIDWEERQREKKLLMEVPSTREIYANIDTVLSPQIHQYYAQTSNKEDLATATYADGASELSLGTSTRVSSPTHGHRARKNSYLSDVSLLHDSLV